ncbi:hypothetical protein [Ruficoccus sp. ZRK36]|uniref:hypothetical protein n=1 Tax=Ruficoccus sp. ZRK36 TaxID=2866311 RepID=UPI001C72C050|nr:hypothetical protein [Ruficoccus sp. ZRK36]QYY37433.1 hypothetical protein K0V07_08085 [Ruficoccus sp. ZRK36]
MENAFRWIISLGTSDSSSIRPPLSVTMDLNKNRLYVYGQLPRRQKEMDLQGLCKLGLHECYGVDYDEIRIGQSTDGGLGCCSKPSLRSFQLCERMDYELSQIKEAGLEGDFLLAWDIVNWAREQGIAVSPGARAAPSSLVSYLLRITDVCPIRFGLLFERLLTDKPTFFVELCMHRGKEVLDYAKSKYGQRCTIRQESATPSEIHEMRGVEYLKPCTLVISDVLTDHEAPSPKGSVKSDLPRVAPGAEYGKSLEIGMRGLNALTVIQDAVRRIRRRAAYRRFDIERISLDDPATFKYICDNSTTAIFQLGVGGMDEHCRECRVHSVEDIAALIAMCGVFAGKFIPQYLGGRKRAERIRAEHPLLADMCKETSGILLYQEQLMLALQAIAGFSLIEANTLRIDFGKKTKSTMEVHREAFIKGAQRVKYLPKQEAHELFGLLYESVVYTSSKSHALAYAVTSYRTAYLKAHFYSEYMWAIVNSASGMAFVQEESSVR